jgi:hypothetical protein
MLKNDETHGLGRFPLQPGKARIFIQSGDAAAKGRAGAIGEQHRVSSARTGPHSPRRTTS